MTPAQKTEAIELLKNKFTQYNNFYITNTESLSVAQINELRRVCFEKQVEMKVAKNTLIKKALESFNDEKYAGVYDSLKGVTALMFSESPKDPAVIITSFRKENKGEKPYLKAALIGEDIFVGDEQLAKLKNIKSKNELVGEVVGLLQSPIRRVVAALIQNSEKQEEEPPAAEAEAAATTDKKEDSTAAEQKEAPAKEDAPKDEGAKPE